MPQDLLARRGVRAPLPTAAPADTPATALATVPATMPATVPVLVLALLVLLSGCGLRLETEPPAPLVPDAAEEARQRTVADALALASTARAAADGLAPDGAEAGAAGTDVAAVLGDVAEAADAHVAALGGVYDPGTDDAGTEDSGTEGSGTENSSTAVADGDPPATEGETPVPVGLPEVLDLLRDTAATARADALTVEDGALARLLGSIALHRTAAADALGGPFPPEATDTHAESDAAAGDTEPAPQDDVDSDSDSDSDGDADAEAAGDADSGPTTTADPGTLVALVRAEDAAGQAWEVVAARSADEERETAAARAAAHREAADLWARAAALVGPDDPRLAEYALDPALLTGDGADGALAVLERDLAARYLALLAAEGADSGGRGRLLDAAADAVVAAQALDGTLEPLPGMPEQQS